MGVDLHAPLGQQDRSRKRRNRAWQHGLWAGLLGLGVLSLSLYTALQPVALSSVAALRDPGPAPEKPVVQDKGAMPTTIQRSPTSGANIQRSTLADGSVVTTYKPAARDGNGPALMSASRIGQDPRSATLPNPDLLEESPVGRLPVIGPDGLRPVEQYARPWSGAHGTRIAIVVGGLGLSQTGTQKAIKTLPEEVTLAFAASGNSLSRWMQDARRGGHEILLQVPMEPLGYPGNNPGRGTLLVDRQEAEILQELHRAMASMTNYTGLMNYMGGRFLSSTQALEPVMRDIAGRGLLFLDDGGSAQSLSDGVGKALNMPHATADVLLDDQLQEQAILKRLDELERVAKRNGAAIGVASAFDESIAAIAKWAHEAKARGIEIVGVSAIALQAQE
ncbi:divergent polysaccharide deacetylase family protein [Rhizobium paknamense]|uniref:Polysaccharide deacetylase 2 family uncharacterized protein YibQ n=1 Tax=Rhizobium paknamense TaxID=1206817 RepID=A0ABU0IGK5_9HYPH|nr:divergent polysaccharide deacetylase family protein [Rhizobium paknamense]MDQ0457383.1 polysaccharide deacetylase 2 family uncharacterized protein YibQ [Rhizobium paknamense]